MKHQEGRYFVNTEDCSESDKKILSDYITFPDVDQKYIFNFKEDNLSEIYFASTQYVIGGYIAEKIHKYKIIYVIELAVNSNLKSRSYGKDIFQRITEIGTEIYKKEFQGIIVVSFCKKTKKSLDDKNAYKLRSAINSGGKIVIECGEVKNKFLHFVYIKCNGGYNEGKIKEIYKEMFES